MSEATEELKSIGRKLLVLVAGIVVWIIALPLSVVVVIVYVAHGQASRFMKRFIAIGDKENDGR